MQLTLDPVSLRPLVAAVVAETLSQRPAELLPADRLGFTEKQAAAALGIEPHILGDARRRGEISARRMGKQYLYSADALRAWLAKS